jgi:hypothetical protein
MNLINAAGNELYIDADEMAVIEKALQLYKLANTSYTNAYCSDKKTTANLTVSERIISRLDTFIHYRL